MRPDAHAAWQGWGNADIAALLALDPVGPNRWRTRLGDANKNGRSYGGQLLGQATMAAHQGIDPARRATQLQFLFLHGAAPEVPIDFEVETLQQGKRFTSVHVRGTQGSERGASRAVCDVTVTFALPLDAPEHQAPPAVPSEDPERLPTVLDVPEAWRERIALLGGYTTSQKPAIDFRIPDLERQLDPARREPRLRFWLRATTPLPADRAVHTSAVAYLSDWWLNFCGLGLHMHALDAARPLYVSSLNHALWLHRPHDADQWMCFDCTSPTAAEGRALAVARVHDRHGRLVASATQECLMAYA